MVTGAATESRAAALSRSADRAQERTVSAFRAAVSLELDRAHGEELGRQARPLLERAIEAGSSEDREASAVAHLLGRRAGDLGLSPTGALALAAAVATSLEGEGAQTDRPELRARMMEGFHAATAERAREAADLRAAAVIPIVRVAPRCFLVAIAGEHSGRALAEIVDAVGRRLLDGDAASCVVDVRGLAGPDGSVVRQLMALHDTCRMLGVVALFTGLRIETLDVAKDAGLDLSDLRVEDSFDEALRVALDASGLELSAPSAIARALRRLGRR